MNYRQSGEGQLMDGEGTRTQVPSNDLQFPSSGPGFPSSGWYPGFRPHPNATSPKFSLIVPLEAIPFCSAFVCSACVKALYECVFSPRWTARSAGWGCVLLICSPTAPTTVPGSGRAPSTRLWGAWVGSRGKGRRGVPLDCRGSSILNSESQ